LTGNIANTNQVGATAGNIANTNQVNGGTVTGNIANTNQVNGSTSGLVATSTTGAHAGHLNR
jgi:predicted aconitase with swiveling domain